MDNELETPSTPNVIVMEQPSVKQQLVQTAVGLGVTIAAGATVIGIGAAIDGIGRAVQRHKAKKAEKNALHAVPTDNE